MSYPELDVAHLLFERLLSVCCILALALRVQRGPAEAALVKRKDGDVLRLPVPMRMLVASDMFGEAVDKDDRRASSSRRGVGTGIKLVSFRSG